MILRPLAVLPIWLWLPEARLGLLPLAVAGVYLLTVIAVLIDSAMRKVPQESLAV